MGQDNLIPGHVAFKHMFMSEESAGQLLNARDPSYDAVIITPPYTLSYLPVSPALHAEAGEDGQAAFRQLATAAVALLATDGVLICNQMSTVRPDGSITAVE